ncbi:hypothetical protein [Aquipuribacter nitratireducens]|uniref:Uncharacterized protein n=1 Tax=Aquipuribacter nitratireducens TaxID=650104 RepID=A0ABW0GQA8_9MICO
MAAHLRASFADLYGGVASLNVWQYNNSYYEAGPEVPRVPVRFHDCQNKGYTPSGWNTIFGSVPVPNGAVPAVGRDAALSVYSPGTDQLWEFWRMERRTDGWYACWGGRIDDASTSDGIFEGNWGSTATGLANSAGMVRIADIRAGRIDHAVNVAIPAPAHWKTFSWPAQRSDGFSTDPHAMPEGIRFRLDPKLDVAALDLHPVAEMIAVAGQRHGFIVTDKAGTLAVTTESGAAEKARTGTDPWVGLLAGTPSYAVLANFPWEHVQVLPMHYGRPQ